MSKYDILTNSERTRQVSNWCIRNTPKARIMRIQEIAIERGGRIALNVFTEEILNFLLNKNGIGDNPVQLATILDYAIQYHGEEKVAITLYSRMIKTRIRKKAKTKKKKEITEEKYMSKEEETKFKYYGHIKSKKTGETIKTKVNIEVIQKTQQVVFRDKKGRFCKPSENLKQKLKARGLIE